MTEQYIIAEDRCVRRQIMGERTDITMGARRHFCKGRDIRKIMRAIYKC